MKTATSCRICRLLKRKCVRLENEKACEACIHAGKLCSFSEKASKNRPLRSRGENESNTGRAHTVLQKQDVVGLVENYLHFLHDKPHSLFHPPTLRSRVKGDKLNKALLYALCAMGSRFATSATIRSCTAKLTLDSKSLLKEDLENVCLENIQTSILVANLCAAELDSSSEALYFAIAVRMAHILDITAAISSDSVVDRETKRRVWWSLFMADRWCSSGLGLPRQITNTDRPTILPMDEDIFNRLPQEQEVLHCAWKPGLWAYNITLAEIFELVHDWHLRLVRESLTENEIASSVEDLAERLESWQERLPQDLLLSEDNLDAHRTKGLGSTFVALHLGFHHYSSLLYFHYLDDRRSQGDQKAEFYASRCRFHASSYSKLLKLARGKGDCEIVYATAGHMTVVSSSVLLHTLLFGDDLDIAAARESLESNFLSLLELKNYWPSLEKWINRLVIFQNKCLHSRDLNTHKVDKWMVRFLLAYATPLEHEAFTSMGTESPITETAVPPQYSPRLRDREQIVNAALEVLLT